MVSSPPPPSHAAASSSSASLPPPPTVNNATTVVPSHLLTPLLNTNPLALPPPSTPTPTPAPPLSFALAPSSSSSSSSSSMPPIHFPLGHDLHGVVPFERDFDGDYDELERREARGEGAVWPVEGEGFVTGDMEEDGEVDIDGMKGAKSVVGNGGKCGAKGEGKG